MTILSAATSYEEMQAIATPGKGGVCGEKCNCKCFVAKLEE